MEENWDDEVTLPSTNNGSSFVDEGRSYGKGRGFKPMNNNNYHGVGSKNGNYKNDNDFGTNGNGNFSSGRRNKNDNFNGNKSFGGGGGFNQDGKSHGFDNGNYNDNDDEWDNCKKSGRFNDRNNDDSRPRRGGRGGGGRGGRGGGGFRSRGDGDEGWGSGGAGSGFNDGDDSKPAWNSGGGRGGRGKFDGDEDKGRRDDGGSFKRAGFGGDGGEEDSEKPPPVTYIPPELSTEESEIFSGVDVGKNFAKYDSIPVKVSGENVPQPIEDFENMGLRKLVLDNLKKSGYTKPTPVQKYAVPILMSGRDLMACAQTGSGKTAAFLVPIINTLLEKPSELKLIGGGCEPHCVVVSPTRELAAQIWEQALKFSKDSMIKCAAAYGGVATMHQGRQIANGCHILVATPGRLKDFVDRRRVSFASLRYMVLDEADRMLDMGFLDDVRSMMDHETMVPKGERQTLMFSATFAENIQTTAADFLNDYLFLSVGIIGGACQDVEQTFHEVSKFEKRAKLKEFLERENTTNMPKTLVFVEMKKTADFIAAFLSDQNFPTTSMHGDRTQEQREEALRDFKRGKRPILVATAVAARGLDIKGVAHVINYDMPKEIDEYVHRIGRTGRVGNCGKATSFFDPDVDHVLVNDLVRILNQAGQNVPDWLSSGGGSFAPSRGEKFGGSDVRKFGNDGYDDIPYNPSNTIIDAEPEEAW